jgi:hypothetical protein
VACRDHNRDENAHRSKIGRLIETGFVSSWTGGFKVPQKL